MLCTIIIKDEVNVKLTGLEINTRKKLVNKFKFILPYARHMPAFKLGRWDGAINFFQLGGSTFVNLLPDILPILVAEGYELEVDDQRDYMIDYELTPVTNNSYEHILWPEGHPIAGQPIVMRDHQTEAINTFFKNPQSIQELATASGKTMITAALSMACQEYGRTLIIVPNRSLVSQTEEDYLNMGLDTGVIFGGRHDYDRKHTICTWQSLDSMIKKQKKGECDVTIDELIEGVVAVIIDECLSGESMITTPTGLKPIKEIQVGDIVINLDEKTNTYKEDIVISVFENLTKSESSHMLELTFDDGTVLEVTANHELLTNKGWIRADALDDEEIIDINTYRGYDAKII